jgi:poly(3-hydroxybutyrate) depolymerase
MRSPTFALAAVSALSLCLPPAFAADCIDHGNPPQPRNAPMAPPSCGNGFGRLLDDYTDTNGERRYACIQEPTIATVPAGGLPLLVYLHPSLFTPDTVYVTNIPEQIDTADLSGDGRRGFILLAPQGRDTRHVYPYPDDSGPGWDNWHRPANPSDNVDVAAIDHYIAAAIATGKVDPKRVFLTGWSNGSAMAIYYGPLGPERWP